MKIIVDKFSFKDGETSHIYILTHAHTDHGSIPQKFKNSIYCTLLTAQILIGTFSYLSSILKPILIPNQWIEIKNKKIFIFDSYHSIGSIGFYYKNMLYWGDGRPNQQMIHFLKSVIQKPLTSIQSDLFFTNLIDPKHDIAYNIPTVEKTKNILTNLIKTKQNIWIRLPHFGALHVLPLNLNYSYVHARDKPIPNKSCFIAYKLLHKSKNLANIKISLNMPKNQTNYFIIYLSTLWWFYDQCPQNRDLHKPLFINENYVRVFLSTHASFEENQLLHDNFLI